MSTEMPRRLPEGCVEDTDRHGNARVYYRAKGRRKVRIRAIPWTPEFMELYEAAKAGTAGRATNSQIAVGTWRWLCVRYFAECAEYKRLGESTRKIRRQILENTFDEPIAPGSDKRFRDFPLSRMDSDAIEVLRDRKIDVPGSANGRLKAIRQVFKFGLKKKWCGNPARDVEYFRTGSTGWHTWTVDEVAQYQERHPIGTKARLALDLIMFTGIRKSDATRLGKQHAKRGKFIFTQHKNRNRKPKRLELPILPILQATIDASPCGDLTFLVTEFGRPFTDNGFGNKMRQWCNEADLPQCSAHGLRKAGATMAANNGASSHQLMAIFGWDSLKQAEVYTRDADQIRLAENAMHMIEARPTRITSGTKSKKR
jgi:integrase